MIVSPCTVTIVAALFETKTNKGLFWFTFSRHKKRGCLKIEAVSLFLYYVKKNGKFSFLSTKTCLIT